MRRRGRRKLEMDIKILQRLSEFSERLFSYVKEYYPLLINNVNLTPYVKNGRYSMFVFPRKRLSPHESVIYSLAFMGALQEASHRVDSPYKVRICLPEKAVKPSFVPLCMIIPSPTYRSRKAGGGVFTINYIGKPPVNLYATSVSEKQLAEKHKEIIEMHPHLRSNTVYETLGAIAMASHLKGINTRNVVIGHTINPRGEIDMINVPDIRYPHVNLIEIKSAHAVNKNWDKHINGERLEGHLRLLERLQHAKIPHTYHLVIVGDGEEDLISHGRKVKNRLKKIVSSPYRVHIVDASTLTRKEV